MRRPKASCISSLKERFWLKDLVSSPVDDRSDPGDRLYTPVNRNGRSSAGQRFAGRREGKVSVSLRSLEKTRLIEDLILAYLYIQHSRKPQWVTRRLETTLFWFWVKFQVPRL